jgi:hypothetical protein
VSPHPQLPAVPGPAGPAEGRPWSRSVRLATLTSSAALTLVTAAALTARLVALGPGGPALVRVDQVVELGVLAAGAVVAWWLAANLTAAAACAGARALGRRWSAGERFVARHAPVIVRRALWLSVGAGIGLAAAVAPAGAQSADPADDLGWVVTGPTAPTVVRVPARTGAADHAAAAGGPGAAPTRTAAPASQPPVAADDQPAPAPSGQPERVTVRPGDSLWTIAARHLPAGSPAAEICTSWPRWYQVNRAVIGDDPNRLRPGQVLILPVGATVTGAGS